MPYFDNHGWLTEVQFAGRHTEVEPPVVPAERIVGELYPNWIGSAWDMIPYTEPTLPEAPPEDERLWWIDVGPFKDRLGMDIGAIAGSDHSACRGVREFLLGRKYVNLKDPKVGMLMDVLIATAQPAADPVWPTSGPLTAEKKALILNTPTTDDERHIKGLPDPVGE